LFDKTQKEDVVGLLVELGIDPGRRGETLSIEEFARLANAIGRSNLLTHRP